MSLNVAEGMFGIFEGRPIDKECWLLFTTNFLELPRGVYASRHSPA